MPTTLRKILHVDMDAFFASVEELDRPELIGHPMAVARDQPRGILTTCNYAARAYGLHSAMPVFQAKKQCPDLILISPDFAKYKKKSDEVFAILRSYTRSLEPVSIDEAYLDISRRPEEGSFIAHAIQDEVETKTGLSLSVGISYNKFLAKLASDWKKPHGIFEIRPEMVEELLGPLPVQRIHGVGRVGAKKLSAFGIGTVADLRLLRAEELEGLFGKHGQEIYRFIRGIDDRPVQSDTTRKSLGIERTFPKDLTSAEDLLKKIHTFSKDLALELQEKHWAAYTFHLKLKTADFQVISRSHTRNHATYEAKEIEEIAQFLFRSVDCCEPIRLLGLSASNLIRPNYRQLRFSDTLHS